MSPWPGMLRLAALRLGVPPRDFWRLSLVEWRALTGEVVAPALDRAAFEALARRYPDEDR